MKITDIKCAVIGRCRRSVPDLPGLGVRLLPRAAKTYLRDGEADFLD